MMPEYSDLLSELNKKIEEVRTGFVKKEEIVIAPTIVKTQPVRKVALATSKQSNTKANTTTVVVPRTIEVKREKKGTTTKIINLKGINSTNYYTILNLKNSRGIIRELTINCNAKFDVYIKSDNNEVINNHGTFDDLSTLSGFSDAIVTSISGSNYVINIRNISFKESINAAIRFDGTVTINNIFCVYDVGEAIPLFGYRDINLREKFNEGTTSIPVGATSVVVAHGLNGTPAIISITPLNEQGLNWFVPDVDITNTNFTLNLQAAPFGVDADFKWSAKLS